MSEPFIGEIRIFAGNFAPRGWAFCNGQLLAISQNTALFSLLGTTYGGNGQTTFALPDLRDRAPMHQGQGAGLSSHFMGEQGGEQAVTLLQSEMPAHTHVMLAGSAGGDQASPANNSLGTAGRGRPALYQTSADTSMSGVEMLPAGGSQPHNNMQPYLALSFIVALQGIFPARN